MRIRDWPIARRTTGAMILLVVATALALQAGSIYASRTKFAEKTTFTLDVAAKKTAAQIDEILRKARATLRRLAQDPAIVDLCLGQESPRLAAMLDAYPDKDRDLSMVLVAGTDGSVLASARVPIDEGANVRARPYFAPALAGRTYQSGMLAGRSGLGVYLSHPIQRIDETLGVLVLKLDGARIGNRVREMVSREGELDTVLYEELGPNLFVVLASSDQELEFTAGKPLSDAQRAEAEARWNRPIRVVPVTALVDLGRGGTAEQGGQEWVFGRAKLDEAPWVVLTRQTREEFDEDFWSLARTLIWILLTVLVAAALLARYQARSILRPVETLTETAELIADGHLEARADIGTDDEIGRLARVFDRMVPQLAENLKLKESLEVAARVQRELLPKEPPRFDGLEVFGANEPYEQIGGDYFDFLDLRRFGDARLAVVVGDVVGHGIGASLLMATARAHVRSRAQPLPELGTLFDEINLRLSADMAEDQFMTLALYAFDPAKGRIDWTSAGQDAAFHLRAGTDEIDEVELKNVPLGVLPDWEYRAGSREDLAKGDVLLIGTDGIWEARNAEREEFGKERLRNLLRMNRDKNAQEIVEAVFGAVTRFRGDLPRQDDLTLVAVKVV
ncbi:MAG: SpoIIE family protein phosphatase [Planctomycetota bacterium]|jgi:serine phosphatase RsbU (regulator of sigma subunit)